MKTDHELIREYQNGDPSAFETLVKRHLDSVYQFFYRITADEMDAEDLAQTVFIKCYKGLKYFRFNAEFTTYLYRAKINTVNTYFSRNKWRNFLHLDEVDVAYIHENDREYAKKELWNFIAKLPRKQREVVLMRLSQNLPFKEISNILNISEDSAKVNYHYGVNKLKDWLKNSI